uniref:Uncharacterized protein n=1 Tax=Solanum lycopersicum TaxID=4081 RepID=A0A3Q7FFR9_SOLLC
MRNVFVDVRHDLVYAYGWPSRLVRPIWKVKRAPKRAYPSLRRFSCAIAYDFLGDPDSYVKNSNFFRRRPSRPCLCIRLSITACPTHFKGQTSPEASIPLFLTIFMCYSTRFFGSSGFRRQKCQIFSWTSVKTFSMHTIDHHGLSDPFGRSNELRSEHTPHFYDFRVLKHTIFWVIRISTSIMPNFFVDVHQDLVYAYVWPSRLFQHIWKVKRAPKRAYPSFRRFSCAIAHDFLGDQDSDVKNAKFLNGRSSRPFLCIGFAITACPTHLEGQTSPEASIPLISTIFVCYSTRFFGLSGFRRQKCQIFSWTSVKTLSMHTIGHHGLYDPFERSNEPRSEHTPHFDDFRVL